MSRSKILGLIIAVIVVISALGSAIVREVYFSTELDENFHVSLFAPSSRMDDQISLSMRRGAQLFVERLNRDGGIDGKGIRLDMDRVEPGATVATVGFGTEHLSTDLPHFSLFAVEADDRSTHGNLFAPHYDLMQEARFLANYSRNVLGHNLVTIIHDESDYGRTAKSSFEATYLRFGTKIRYSHAFSNESDIAAIVAEVSGKKDAGTLFVAARAGDAAKIVTRMRDAGFKGPIVGLDGMATSAFAKGVPAPRYADGLVATTPLLLDTAGQQTQVFKELYRRKYGEQPDWIAANAYEAMGFIADGLRRNDLRGHLDALKTPGKDVVGVTGTMRFKSDGTSLKPIQLGVYNGLDIVASMIQLRPLKEGSPTNYFDEIKKGRMLYVNDRFMYKTNVVYTGVQIENITNLDIDSRTADIEFSLWFRSKGKFLPEDVQFDNALEEIALGAPLEEMHKDGITFKIFRAKGSFGINFLDVQRRYGNHIVGLSFKHRELDRNNLLYVVDVLGLELNKERSLMDILTDGKVLDSATGWKMIDAWLSQEIVKTSTFGKPLYVGFGSLDPEYSQISLGTIIEEDRFHARNVIPSEYFVYIAILGLVGAIFAWGTDKRTSGYFWSISTWLMRVVFWYLALLAIGNLLLDLSIGYLTHYYTERIEDSYSMLWWLVGALLAAIGLERFVWTPLEEKTEKKIPNVVRMFGIGVVFLLAIFGIVAFVLGKPLTSLMATGGLLTMIIGLAIQSNISNVFSGIILNVERPYTIGDWINIDGVGDGLVLDMTWRTLRLKSWRGEHISVPNSKAAEAKTVNYLKGIFRQDLKLMISSEHQPSKIKELLREASDSVPVANKIKPAIIFHNGLRNVYGTNLCSYQVRFWSDDFVESFFDAHIVWEAIWEVFRKHDILITESNHNETTEKARREQAAAS